MKQLTTLFIALTFSALVGIVVSGLAQSKAQAADVQVANFLELLRETNTDTQKALRAIEDNWQPGFAIMLAEIMSLTRNTYVVDNIIELLEEKTKQKHSYDLQAWRVWLWNQPENDYQDYAEFKSQLYRLIDLKFAAYFNNRRDKTIRLDEVVWGGVRQDGIPPLRQPKMLDANDADYLDDSNIIFGIEVNGDARAYPKRIMAWHEMFVDKVGGKPVAGVYCTLCGSMILYDTVVDGTNYEIGTSGFLYRSNKLMYDKRTQSLWNTLWGTPVIGPLVDRDIKFDRLSIVTTTWKEWKRRHPQTKVLSLDTGHRRDYGEGVAYKEYFATDNLMFHVPQRDSRLKNKSEVLGLLFTNAPEKPLAISAEYLNDNPLYQGKLGGTEFVVLTDKSGANRVYDATDLRFTSWDQDNTVKDEKGRVWRLTEEGLRTDDGKKRARLPAHRAFWFGWFSAYSHTALIN